MEERKGDVGERHEHMRGKQRKGEQKRSKGMRDSE